ncbi:beta-lactamase family protein [Granulicella sp. WH15]|uniref:serine hydrolase domain-containing protein n=1 Tax=Granulicella sp. WH15 TaxID=2602070 RepID=UPI001366E077|nr:serine hydrolase domain-containing protein [Granulicella sp. WH15]QHN03506.1 beta-lactamase family protein [Granulicella sp. WH15]
MKKIRIASTIRFTMMGLLIATTVAVPCIAQKPAHNAPDEAIVKPETVGFSSERLERLHALIQQEVDGKQLAGAVTILARHGKIVDYRTYGQRDIASGTSMTKDVIFRDYSMTKPITGVAMMILYEEGKWLPSDPIAKYIPEFEHLKVFKGVDADGKAILVDPDHPPTLRELMSHTAGFSYGSGHTVVDAMYQDQKVMQSTNLQEMIDKLAKIPLNYQPGKGWTYSASMDIEGYIVEKLSGQTLPDFVRDHITVPLEMKDAGFFVPAEKRSRFASNYRPDAQDHLVPVEANSSIPTDYATQPTMPSGGGGMVSTAIDYYRFAQMLANGGELDGKRILAPATVKLMTSNHLPESLLTGEFGIGLQVMRPGFGYGFNCAVVFDPLAATLPDGKGTFFWDGAAGTWFWVDPTNDVVFVAMIQRMGGHDNHRLEYRSHATVYQALLDPSK